VTSRFQLALYANYQWTKIVRKVLARSIAPTDTTRFTGFFGPEAIYQVLNPFSDAFGFRALCRAGDRRGERALEGKCCSRRISSKTGLDLARQCEPLNMRWEHDVEADDWEHESALELYLGCSYRFAPGWYGGVELLNENGYEGHLLFDHAHAETNAFYFGPTLHYGSERWWATLAVYQQLPWAGNPADDAGAISHGLLVTPSAIGCGSD
jgi:hypothetical protein